MSTSRDFRKEAQPGTTSKCVYTGSLVLVVDLLAMGILEMKPVTFELVPLERGTVDLLVVDLLVVYLLVVNLLLVEVVPLELVTVKVSVADLLAMGILEMKHAALEVVPLELVSIEVLAVDLLVVYLLVVYLLLLVVDLLAPEEMSHFSSLLPETFGRSLFKSSTFLIMLTFDELMCS